MLVQKIKNKIYYCTTMITFKLSSKNFKTLYKKNQIIQNKLRDKINYKYNNNNNNNL